MNAGNPNTPHHIWVMYLFLFWILDHHHFTNTHIFSQILIVWWVFDNKFTSAWRDFGSVYFCHFAPVLEPRHIRTRQKRLAFCLESQPKQKLHILSRFCWELRPYVPLCIFNIPSSPPEILGSHHGSTIAPLATAMSETHNQRSIAIAIFSFIVRAICGSCHHHGTSMFFIH